MTGDTTRLRIYHFLGLLTLIVAGEAIFSLPFHVVRFFRPTVLEVFQITNTQIGQVQSTYGIVAMLSYFLGGPLADRYPAKNLIVVALLATALGGVYFAQIPSVVGLHVLYGFWGCSTILLFWCALIKATREWGSLGEQGRAFGFLEAGRGLFAALLTSIAVAILHIALPDQLENLVEAERVTALKQIIYLYVGATLLAGFAIYFFLPRGNESAPQVVSSLNLRERMRGVFRNRLVWPQMLIVVCAYIGYKGVDNYVLYAVQGYGMDEVEGSFISASSSWIRPIAAIAAGFLADRFRASRIVTLSFVLLCVGYAPFALITPAQNLLWVLLVNVAITSVAVYALHAIYFALLAESKIALPVTGTAIGVISVVGFTPDIFFAPAMGWLLDNHSVVQGHQMVFALLGAFAVIGLVSSLLFVHWSPSISPPPSTLLSTPPSTQPTE